MYSIESLTLSPGDVHKVGTGVAVELPSGSVGLLWDRSSMGAKGVRVLGGVIDEGYRGEIKVVLSNVGRDTIHIKKGDKIAQFLIQPIMHMSVEEVETLTEASRGEKGFGSSGQ
jgi:dUTP pyrophosphatase